MQIPIEDIVTIATSNLVIAALLVSLVGATLATAIRHKTSENWHPNLEDAWYYILSGGLGVALVLLGQDTATILGVTAGVNTPLAVLRTAIDRRANANDPKLSKASDEAIIAEARKRSKKE